MDEVKLNAPATDREKLVAAHTKFSGEVLDELLEPENPHICADTMDMRLKLIASDSLCYGNYRQAAACLTLLAMREGE